MNRSRFRDGQILAIVKKAKPAGGWRSVSDAWHHRADVRPLEVEARLSRAHRDAEARATRERESTP
jgi:hypothetical protein